MSTTASAPNVASLVRRAQGIAAGSARHRHRGDDALGRGHYRLQRIVLSAKIKRVKMSFERVIRLRRVSLR